MLETVGLVGLLATLGMLGRVLMLAIALRGTLPAERPAIIRALNASSGRLQPRRRTPFRESG
jgi:hypothetical protein